MTIPVYINQLPLGTLTVSQSGLYTVIEASADAQGLVRLWAHGSGKSACLGIMEPKDGGLYLRRRLSRLELAAFPDPIEFASDRELENIHNIVDIINTDEEITPADEAEPLSNDPRDTEPEPDGRPKGESDYHTCPWPAEPPEDGLLWYRRGDGSLVSFDGVSSLLAIPARLRETPAQAVERVIEGKKYLVFRY